MKFSVGYNYDSGMFAFLKKHKNAIEAFYFPIPQGYGGSGRHRNEPPLYPKQIPALLKTCRTLGIKSQLLFNATCEGRHGFRKSVFNNVAAYIQELKDQGLDAVVLANPVYMSALKKKMPDLIIESSVNCYVRSVEHAMHLRDMGVDVVTVDRDINRDIDLIKKIKHATGLKIRLMLNEGCLGHCPYRVSHYNYISHKGIPRASCMEGVFLDAFCISLYVKNPLKVFRIPFVPPEALSYYKGCADFYKLSTRVFTTQRIAACLDAYRKEYFNGNLLDILDCPGLSFFDYIDYAVLKKNKFFEKMQKCDMPCNGCRYCGDLFRQAVVIKTKYLKENTETEQRRTIRIFMNALKRPLDNDTRLQAFLRIGQAYVALRNFKDAIRFISKSLPLRYRGDAGYSLVEPFSMKAGANEKTIKAQRYFLLGICYQALGYYIKAIRFLRKAEASSAGEGSIKTRLVECIHAFGNRERMRRLKGH